MPSGCAGLCLFSAGRRCGELGSPDPIQGLLDEFLAAVDVEDSVREAGIGHELGQNRGDVVTWDAALERCRLLTALLERWQAWCDGGQDGSADPFWGV